MAIHGPNLTIPGLVAGADLSAAGNQYKFVKLTAANTVGLCTATTDVPIGVLQNRPESGEAASVISIGVTKIQGDANLAAGDKIGPSSDSQADAKVPTTDANDYWVGTVIEDNAAAGGLCTAVINCATPFLVP